MALTKAQRARLDKLATYLEGLPADYSHFDMADFIVGDFEPSNAALREYALKNGGFLDCGTAACAVGHGPAAGILIPVDMVSAPTPWHMWIEYSALFVGTDDRGKPIDNRFEWLFGQEWNEIDNTHFGAAARIRYLLDKGTVPVQFYDAAHGDDFVDDYAPYRIDAKAQADA